MMLSLRPMRVNVLKNEELNLLARQKWRVWAKSILTPMVFKKCVFPDMLEPVTSIPPVLKLTEFGTGFSNSGCATLSILRDGVESVSSGSTDSFIPTLYDEAATTP